MTNLNSAKNADNEVVDPEEDGSGGSYPIYLAAGTEHGSIYLWRFNEADCNNKFLVTNSNLDDGTRLLAILHSSNRPIINIAMLFKREPPIDSESTSVGAGNKNNGLKRFNSNVSEDASRSSGSKWRSTYGTPPPPHKLILCASDTVGVVRTYIQYKQLEEKDNGSYVSGSRGGGRRRLKSVSSLQSFGEDGSVFGNRIGGRIVDDDQKSLEGLMLTGESQFNSPVVSCLLREVTYVRNKEESEIMDEHTREINKQLKFSNLASSLTDLGPPLLKTVAWGAPEENDDENEFDSKDFVPANNLVVIQANDEIRFYPVLKLMSSLQTKSTMPTELGRTLAVITEMNSNLEDSLKMTDNAYEMHVHKPFVSSILKRNNSTSDKSVTNNDLHLQPSNPANDNSLIIATQNTSISVNRENKDASVDCAPEPHVTPPPVPIEPPSKATDLEKTQRSNILSNESVVKSAKLIKASEERNKIIATHSTCELNTKKESDVDLKSVTVTSSKTAKHPSTDVKYLEPTVSSKASTISLRQQIKLSPSVEAAKIIMSQKHLLLRSIPDSPLTDPIINSSKVNASINM